MSDAKYCMFVDMADVTIHGTSELEVGKKLIYRLIKDAQDCQKDVSNGYQYENSTHLEHDDAQCKTEVTNARRTRFSNGNDLQK